MAPSRHDWKIVDWDVKPQHNQLLNLKCLRVTGWLKNAKIASFTTDSVSFILNLYTKINYKNRELILVV